MDAVDESTAEQRSRAEARLNLLAVMRRLRGCRVEVHLCGLKEPVQAEFVACRPLLEHFIFKDFRSPSGLLSRAIVRGPDVIRLCFTPPDDWHGATV